MGHKMTVADGQQPDVHYENRVFHKERECNQQTTHEIDKAGNIRSRSVGRVSSRTHSGAASPKSEHHKSEHHKSKHHNESKHHDEASTHHESKQSHRSAGKSSAGSARRSSGAGCAPRSSGSGKAGCARPSSGSGCSPPKRAKSSCKLPRKSRSDPMTVRECCYDLPKRRQPQPCTRGPKWQTGKYRRDICGSGIEPARYGFMAGRRKLWCKTPLSMYQATIGEIGRQLLCREVFIPRDVKPGPPSNIEEYILPPCRGYYRKYDCLRPCEEDFVTFKQGKKVYRDRVERYWEPCLVKEQKHHLDINTYAHHNAALGLKVRRYNLEVPCW